MRNRLNAHHALKELSHHGGLQVTPKPEFNARYTVHPDRLAEATFDYRGFPTDPGMLMTADEYYDIFGTRDNDKGLPFGPDGTSTGGRPYNPGDREVQDKFETELYNRRDH